MKYRALRVVKYVYKGIGTLLIVLGLYALVGNLVVVIQRSKGLPDFSPLGSLLYIILAGVFIFSFGELIDLLITLATDTHYVADYFRKATRSRQERSK